MRPGERSYNSIGDPEKPSLRRDRRAVRYTLRGIHIGAKWRPGQTPEPSRFALEIPAVLNPVIGKSRIPKSNTQSKIMIAVIYHRRLCPRILSGEPRIVAASLGIPARVASEKIGAGMNPIIGLARHTQHIADEILV